jgi:hypothetical protein
MNRLQRPPSAQPTSSAAVILALGRALSPRPRASCAHSEALRPGDRGLAIAVSSRAVQGLPSRHSMISRSANLGEKRRVVIFVPAIQSLGEWRVLGHLRRNEPQPGVSGPPQNAEIPSGYRHFSSWPRWASTPLRKYRVSLLTTALRCGYPDASTPGR